MQESEEAPEAPVLEAGLPAALRIAGVSSDAPATLRSLACALCEPDVSPFRLYQVLSLLREGQVREVLQDLLTLAVRADAVEVERDGDECVEASNRIVGAVVRTLLVSSRAPEITFACEELRSAAYQSQVWPLRHRSLFAFVAGTEARDVLDWGPTLAEFAGQRRKRESVDFDDVDSEFVELRMAGTLVLGMPNEARAALRPPVVSWEVERKAGGIERPTVWSEIAWSDFARSCAMGQSSPFPLACNGFDSCRRDLRLLNDVSCDETHMRSSFVRVEGIRLRRRRPRSSLNAGIDRRVSKIVPDVMRAQSGRVTETFICTNNTRDTERLLAMALADGRPVLLEGPAGCGKSHLLQSFALKAAPLPNVVKGDDSVVRIHMDSVTGAGEDDLTALLGSVVPLPNGGGFRWRPGPIGVALESGAWLILENVAGRNGNSAIAMIISRIASLRPGDYMEAPGRGDPLKVGSGFALIATHTISSIDESASRLWEPPGGWASWRRIAMPSLSEPDMFAILSDRYPSIEDCISRVLRTISSVQAVLHGFSGRSQSPVRHPGMRDAVKLCCRLEALRGLSENINLTPESAALEALDVLCKWESNSDRSHGIVCAIAAAWSLPVVAVEDIAATRVPLLVCQTGTLSIGRGLLHSSREHETEGQIAGGSLALNGHTCRLLEAIARAVQLGEHILLTGESGSGKTASVQELATRLGKQLVVVNMSRSSDITDLIGGFRPVDLSSLVPKLARKFESAFCRTVSRQKNGRFLRALQGCARDPSRHVQAIRLMRGALNAIPRNCRGITHGSDNGWIEVEANLASLETKFSQFSGEDHTAEILGSVQEVQSSSGPLRPAKKRRVSPSRSNSKDGGGEGRETTSARDFDTLNESPVKPFEFEFLDGALVTAMRSGHWILLDEINLAPAEILERLVGVLDEHQLAVGNASGEVVNSAKGFALFTAMNPPGDIGKRPLTPAFRARFTEFYVGDCTNREDIVTISLARMFSVAHRHNRGRGSEELEICNDIAEFYLAVHRLAACGDLMDGTGKKIRFSLRTLSRMLDFGAGVSRFVFGGSSGQRKALFEGALLAFGTPLSLEGRQKVSSLASRVLLRRSNALGASILQNGSANHEGRDFDLCDVMHLPDNVGYVKVAGFPIESSVVRKGREGASVEPNVGDTAIFPDKECEKFIVTGVVKDTMRSVCRALVAGSPRLPVLLQGPTAAGKTSLVAHLARLTGKKLVRLNNHEHTDVGEYIGVYICAPDGTLEFREGPLVQAARNGDWVVLDELNLAPPDVLEALNRLLDDNREIRIPETGEVVRAAPGFAIFATQNPPGLYGGRKELSQAFRGRFIEVHVCDLPDADLKEILVRRTSIPPSFADRMVSVMRQLQMRRRDSHMFAGKSGFVTVRDLFRWASRRPRTKLELAMHGFFLLGERSRRPAERELVREVLVKQIGVDQDDMSDPALYKLVGKVRAQCGMADGLTGLADERSSLLNRIQELAMQDRIVLAPSMRRILTLLSYCAMSSEPALLVGETGTGKTTACAIVARAFCAPLATVNCHRHTDASDFIGSYRPARRKPSSDKQETLFEWADGPLVAAMRDGGTLLVDEINMADDAVTERLNSVLETERTLLVVEKGGLRVLAPDGGSAVSAEVVRAHSNFHIFATMNPGGDFGKKELSPAMRNRFTEIWVPVAASRCEYEPIIGSRILSGIGTENADLVSALNLAGEAIVDFVCWNMVTSGSSRDSDIRCSRGPGSSPRKEATEILEESYVVSLRDATAWAEFVRVASVKCGLHPMVAFAHGARLIILDGLTVGAATTSNAVVAEVLWRKVLDLVPSEFRYNAAQASFETTVWTAVGCDGVLGSDLEFGPFRIPRQGMEDVESCSLLEPEGQLNLSGYDFDAATTKGNCGRIARAMILHPRPILLEGPPGSGKSSLIEALAAASNAHFCRINLSEHTEMADLLGGFVPGSEAGIFRFKSGPLLTAMREGHWVLLDELNLASQSVLEGLNAVLDHRRSVFVNELDQEFCAVERFQVFGAQNSAHDGGGRRGLPRSFLNRFSRVAIQAPSDEDIEHIASMTHPGLPSRIIKMVTETLGAVKKSLSELHGNERHKFDDDFNLRDALRWCSLLDGIKSCEIEFLDIPRQDEWLRDDKCDVFFDAVVLQRLESDEAHAAAIRSFEQVFGRPPVLNLRPTLRRSCSGNSVRVGQVILPRKASVQTTHVQSGAVVIPSRVRHLEALALAVSSGWPAVVSCGSSLGSDGVDGRVLVESLAQLCGRRLTELNVGSSTDCSDLLGGFSQRDAVREIRSAVSVLLRVAETAMTALIFGPHQICVCLSESVCSLENAHRTTLDITKRSLAGPEEMRIEHLHVILRRVQAISDQISAIPCINAHDSDLADEISRAVTAATTLTHAAAVILASKGGAFEWRRSKLVHALEQGDWIIVPNADQCPAAVLDRLNPLLERPALHVSSEHNSQSRGLASGSLLVAEAPPDSDGSPAAVKPHPDFRIFMTVVKHYSSRANDGLSKALRNRALEICIRGTADIADRVSELVNSGTPLRRVTRILGLSDEYRMSIQAIPAVSDRLAFRLADFGRSIYSHTGRTPSFGFSCCMGEGSEYPEVAMPAHEEQSWKEPSHDPSALAFMTSLRANCIDVRRLITCASDFSLGRDISVLGIIVNSLNLAVLDCDSQLTWCAPLTMIGATFDCVRDFKVDRGIVIARMLYHAVEACVASSTSLGDMMNRVSALSHVAHSQLGENLSSAIVSAVASASASCAGFGYPESSDLTALRRKCGVACVPIDPVYGMDHDGQVVLERTLTTLELGYVRKRACSFRIRMAGAVPFLETWSTMIRRREAGREAGSLDNFESSHFFLSRRVCTAGTDVTASAHDCGMEIYLVLYPLLKAAAELAGKTDEIVANQTTWTISSLNSWIALFRAMGALCEWAMQSGVSGYEAAAQFSGYVRVILRAVQALVPLHDCVDPLNSALETVKLLCPHLLWYSEYTSMSKQGLPSPRVAESIEIEQDICRVIRLNGPLHFDGEARMALSEALVSISTHSISSDSAVLCIISEVPRAVSMRLRSRDCKMPKELEFVPFDTIWSCIGKYRTLGSMASSIRSWCHIIDTYPELSQSTGKVLRQGLKTVVRSELIGLADLVPFQRMTWLMDAIWKKKCSQSPTAFEVELEQSRREGIVALLNNMSTIEVARRGDEPRVHSIPVGNEISTVAMQFLATEVPKLPLEEFRDSSTRLKFSALALVGGYLDDAYLIATPGSALRFLLMSSLLDVCRTAAETTNSEAFEHLKTLENGDSEQENVFARAIFNCATSLSTKQNLDSLLKAASAVQKAVSESRHGDAIYSFPCCIAYFGSAWVYTGLSRLSLVAERLAKCNGVDPALVAAAEADLVGREAVEAFSARSAYSLVENNRSGGGSVPDCGPIYDADQRGRSQAAAYSSAKLLVAYRPHNQASFKALPELLNRLMSSTLREPDVIALMTAMEADGDACTDDLNDSCVKATNVVEAIKAVLRRLQLGGDLSHLRDLSGDFVRALAEIRYGLVSSLSACRLTIMRNDKFVGAYLKVANELLKYPHAAATAVFDPQKLLSHCKRAKEPIPAVIVLMKFVASHVDTLGSRGVDCLVSGFNEIVATWKRKLIIEEKAEQEMNSVFQIQTAIQNLHSVQQGSTGSNEVEEDFDYDEMFTSDVKELDEVSEDDARANGDVPCDSALTYRTFEAESRESSFAINASVVWIMFRETFDVSDPNRLGRHGVLSRENIQLKRTSVFSEVVTTCALACASVDDARSVLPLDLDFASPVGALCASLALGKLRGLSHYDGSSDLEGERSIGQPMLRNFYTDSNPAEAVNGVRVLNGLIVAGRRVQREKFANDEGHPVLARVILSAEKVAKTGISTPLATLVVGFENVLRKADEWQRHFAAKDIKLSTEVKSVAEVATRWRAMEMSSWPSLIDDRMRRFERRAHKWFLYLYDAILGSEIFSTKVSNDLMTTLDQFLRSSPCGEFALRLRMLVCFSSYVAQLSFRSTCDTPPLSHFLNGLSTYYEQFAAQVETCIHTRRAELQRRLAELASLARWDKETDLGSSVKMNPQRDRHLEYHRLKAASEHTRRKLHKICREMDVALRKPVADVILNRDAIVKQADPFAELEVEAAEEQCEVIEGSASESQRRASFDASGSIASLLGLDSNANGVSISCSHHVTTGRLARLPNVSQRMKRIADTFIKDSSNSSVLGVSVVSSLRSLIRNRVKLLKHAPKVGVQAKKKALVDLLRSLKDLGVSPYPATVPECRRVSSFWLSSPKIDLGATDVDELLNREYFAVAHGLKCLREAASGSNLSADIARREATQMVSFCTHLFDMAIDQRAALSKALSHARRISAFSKCMREFVPCPKPKKATENQKCRNIGMCVTSLEAVRITEESYRRLASIFIDLKIASQQAHLIAYGNNEFSGDEGESHASLNRRYQSRDGPLNVEFASLVEPLTSNAKKACDVLSQAVRCFEALTKMKASPVLSAPTALESPLSADDILTSSRMEFASSFAQILQSLIEGLGTLLQDAELVSASNLARAMLKPVLEFCRETEAKIEVASRSDLSQEVPEMSSLASRQAEKIIKACLLGTQRIVREFCGGEIGDPLPVHPVPKEIVISKDSGLTKPVPIGDPLAIENALLSAHSAVMSIEKHLDLDCVCSGVEMLLRDLRRAPVDEDRAAVETLVRANGVFLGHFLYAVVLPTLSHRIAYHFNGLKLLSTLEKLFTGLCREGFCRPPEESSGTFEENLQSHDGAGFGDVGDGDTSLARDVSDQIEDEEQLLGLGNETAQQNLDDVRKDQDDESNGTAGFEMASDFDGELQDGSRAEGEEEDGPDAPGPEKEFTKETFDKADVVDERLWDGDEAERDPKKVEGGADEGAEIEGRGRGGSSELVGRKPDSVRQKLGTKPHEPNEIQDKGELAEGELDRNQGDDTDMHCDDAAAEERGNPLSNAQIDDDLKNRSPKLEGGENALDDTNEYSMNGEAKEPDNIDVTRADEDVISMEDVEGGNKTEEGSDETGHGNDFDDTARGHGKEEEGDDPGQGDLPLSDLESAIENCDAMGNNPADEVCERTSENELDNVGNQEMNDFGTDGQVKDSMDERDADTADLESLGPDHLGTSISDPETEQDPSLLDVQDPCKQRKSDLGENSDLIRPDGGTLTTEEILNSDAPARDVMFGSFGGTTEQNAGAHDNSDDVRNSGKRSGGQEHATGLRKSSNNEPVGSELFGDALSSEQKDECETTLERLQQDTNPHRVSPDGELVKSWEKRLSLLTSAMDIAGQGPQENNGLSRADQLYSFVNEPDVDPTEYGTQNAKYTLGPATDEQQRPLPDHAIAEEREQAERHRDHEDEAEFSQKVTAPKSAVHVGAQTSSAEEVGDERAEKMSYDHGLTEKSEGGMSRVTTVAAENAVKAAESRSHRSLSTAAVVSGTVHIQMNIGAAVTETLEELPEDRVERLKPKLVTGLSEADGARLWRRLEYLTMSNAQSLCEQLRLVLEPTVATGLSGDFRSGKRLNMRRVVDYVASDFRRDRIWLRRVRPEKRSFDVLLAIDDSESMAESSAGPVALEALALLTSALSKLEVGRVAVVTFGTNPELVRSFEEPLPIDDGGGARLLQKFTFAQKNTNVKRLLDFMSIQLKESGSLSGGTGEEVRLAFIISDGRLSERAEVRRRICELRSARVLVAFIIIDSAVGGRKSIFEVQRVEYEPDGSGTVNVTPYMDSFPVEFYAVVRDVSALPTVLADALRQWFEVVNS